jgi:hypothetical protein
MSPADDPPTRTIEALFRPFGGKTQKKRATGNPSLAVIIQTGLLQPAYFAFVPLKVPSPSSPSDIFPATSLPVTVPTYLTSIAWPCASSL